MNLATSLQLNKPVAFLWAMIGILALILIFVCQPAHRTYFGNSIRSKFMREHSKLEKHGTTLADGQRLPLALALFGPAVLLNSEFDPLRKLLAPGHAQSSGGCSSSDGGCGGGGCGGGGAAVVVAEEAIEVGLRRPIIPDGLRPPDPPRQANAFKKHSELRSSRFIFLVADKKLPTGPAPVVNWPLHKWSIIKTGAKARRPPSQAGGGLG